MPPRTVEIAGLRTTLVGDPAARLAIVLLHGYSMTSADLAPFGGSLGVPALYVFPEGPCEAAPGRSWWPRDEAARLAALQHGPLDLAEDTRPGLPAARDRLDALLAEVSAEYTPEHLVLGGFSQGGVLACDWVLHAERSVHGLILLSTSRLDIATWRSRSERLRNLRAFVSHGRQDPEFAFAAGEGLRDFLIHAGADVTWVPFDGGHEIPLPVWRGLRKFLRARLAA
jgi:phospholipase/carboxylesterase